MEKKTTSAGEFSGQLVKRGIQSKGYGIIEKGIVMDRDLSITAKAIYCYLSSLSSSGKVAFPSRSRMINDLNMSKEQYYIGLNELCDAGIITIERAKSKNGTFSNNIYHLEDKPKKYMECPYDNPKIKRTYSIISSYGLMATGWGICPYSVMANPKIKAKPKVLFCYISVLIGAKGNDDELPYVDLSPEIIRHDLGICSNTYYKYVQDLTSANYLSVAQLHQNGRNTKYVRYSINYGYEADDNPQSVGSDHQKKKMAILTLPPTNGGPYQTTKKPDTVKRGSEMQTTKKPDTVKKEPEMQTTKKPDMVKKESEMQTTKKPDMVKKEPEMQTTKKPDMVNQDMVDQDMRKPDTNITSLTITSFNNTSFNTMYGCIEAIRQKIHFSILKKTFSKPQSADALNDLVEVVAETLCSTNEMININSSPMLTESVKDVLVTINNKAVCAVINRYLARINRITLANRKPYLLTAIYNELTAEACGADWEDEEAI